MLPLLGWSSVHDYTHGGGGGYVNFQAIPPGQTGCLASDGPGQESQVLFARVDQTARRTGLVRPGPRKPQGPKAAPHLPQLLHRRPELVVPSLRLQERVEQQHRRGAQQQRKTGRGRNPASVEQQLLGQLPVDARLRHRLLLCELWAWKLFRRCVRAGPEYVRRRRPGGVLLRRWHRHGHVGLQPVVRGLILRQGRG